MTDWTAEEAPPNPYAAPAPEPTRRPRWLVPVVAASLAALVIAGGGTAWWLLSSKLGPAATPQAAVEKLVDGIVSLDIATLGTAIAPSELSLIAGPLTELSEAHPDSTGVDLIADLKDVLTITTSGMTYDVTEIADGIARVTWTGGSVTADGDVSEVAAVLSDAFAPIITASLSGALPQSDIDDAVAQAKSSMVESLELPATLDAPQAVPEDFSIAISLVAVEEGGGWYVSPMLSAADYTFEQSASYVSIDPELQAQQPELGTSVPAAAASGTPEQAAEAVVDALWSGSVSELAATLPLPERRLLAIYGNGLEEGLGSVAEATLEKRAFTAETDGERARVAIDSLVVEAFDTTVEISGLCMTTTGEFAGTSCLTDIPMLAELGADDLDFIAVQEGDGWYLSATATYVDALAILYSRILDHLDAGTLDELYEETNGYFGNPFSMLGYGFGYSDYDDDYVEPEETCTTDGDVETCVIDSGDGYVYTCAYLGDMSEICDYSNPDGSVERCVYGMEFGGCLDDPEGISFYSEDGDGPEINLTEACAADAVATEIEDACAELEALLAAAP